MGPHVLQQLVHNHEVGQGGEDVSHPLLGEAGPLGGGARVQGQPGLKGGFGRFVVQHCHCQSLQQMQRVHVLVHVLVSWRYICIVCYIMKDSRELEQLGHISPG